MNSKKNTHFRFVMKSLKAKISASAALIMLFSILIGVTSLSQAQADNLVCPSGTTLSTVDNLCHATAPATTTTAYSCPANYTMNGSGSTTTCTEIYSATPSYSCPLFSNNSPVQTGTISADQLTCSYPPYLRTVQVGICPNNGIWVGGLVCYNTVIITPAVYAQNWHDPVTTQVWNPAVQVWNPPVTTQVWNPPVTTTVNHAAVYAWSPPVQVWVAPVTTTVTVPASTTCQYSTFVSKVVCTTTPAHTSTTTTAGYWLTTFSGGYVLVTAAYTTTTTTPGYYTSTTTPGYYTTTPGYYTTSTTPGYYTNGALITPAVTSTTTSYNANLTNQSTPMPAHSDPSAATYSCSGSDVLSGSGTSSSCTASAAIIATSNTTYTCPSNYSPSGTVSTPEDCTTAPLPPSAPDPVQNLTVGLTNGDPNATTLTLTWTTPNSNGSPITSYDVYWDGQFSDSSQLIPASGYTPDVVTGTTNSIQVQINLRTPNLTPNYTSINITAGEIHNFWVIANNGIGSSDVGDVESLNNPCMTGDAFCNDQASMDSNLNAAIAATPDDTTDWDADGNYIGPVDTPIVAPALKVEPSSLSLIPSVTSSAASGTQTQVVIDTMMNYSTQFLSLEKLLTQGESINTLPYAVDTIYGWGSGHSSTPLSTVAQVDSLQTTDSSSTVVTWGKVVKKYCPLFSTSSQSDEIACDQAISGFSPALNATSGLNSIVVPFSSSRPDIVNKSPAICNNSALIHSAPVYAKRPTHATNSSSIYELYDATVFDCSLPFVDCSGFVDNVLTWALHDAGLDSLIPSLHWNTKEWVNSSISHWSNFGSNNSLPAGTHFGVVSNTDPTQWKKGDIVFYYNNDHMGLVVNGASSGQVAHVISSVKNNFGIISGPATNLDTHPDLVLRFQI